MVLACMLQLHEEELYADFQEYYGLDLWALDIWGDEYTYDVRRASVLAAQLPRNSRAMCAIDPLNGVSKTDMFLREIEHHWRGWIWAHSEDGKNRTNEPEPIRFEGEEDMRQRARERAVQQSRQVARAFGFAELEATT